jgi:DNA-directed RNA polymerase subunit RPC12/RpoP
MLNIVMFIKEYLIDTWHMRRSKLGKQHTYCRKKTMVVLRCDNCNTEFTRERGKMDPKRLNNNYFHVCENCDAKRFAQKRGVNAKQVWSLKASSDMPIWKI